MLKVSTVKLPDNLPENDGALMFLWIKDSKNTPSMTWDKMTDQKIGEAFQILLDHMIMFDVRNAEIAHKAVDVSV